MRRVVEIALGVSLAAALPAVGQEEAAATKKVPIPAPQEFVTQHVGTFDGVEVAYTARAGETYLRDDDGEPKASFFSFAHTMDGVEDLSERPVMFIWNGGPGSASLWLHMGTFGPVRVVVPSDAEDAGAPPYPLVDNPLTLLDITDLVFVDPVGTGFSRPLGEHEGKEFWGLNEDAASVAEFIQQWVTSLLHYLLADDGCDRLLPRQDRSRAGGARGVPAAGARVCGRRVGAGADLGHCAR